MLGCLVGLLLFFFLQMLISLCYLLLLLLLRSFSYMFSVCEKYVNFILHTSFLKTGFIVEECLMNMAEFQCFQIYFDRIRDMSPSIFMLQYHFVVPIGLLRPFLAKCSIHTHQFSSVDFLCDRFVPL